MFLTCRRFAVIFGSIALLGFARSPLHAQGNVLFANDPLSTGGAVNAPVRCANGTAVTGSQFLAMLYARPAGSSSPYVGVGEPVPFRNSHPLGGGYWVPAIRTIDGIGAGQQARITVRIWPVAEGLTWEEARVNGMSWSETSPINVTLGTPETPAFMVGLQSMTGLDPACVPEPRSWALCFLSLATLALAKSAHRRVKK